MLSWRKGQSSPNAAAAGKAVIHQTHGMPNNKSKHHARLVNRGFNEDPVFSLHKLVACLHGRFSCRPRPLLSAEHGGRIKRRHCTIEEQKVCPPGVDSEEMLRALRTASLDQDTARSHAIAPGRHTWPEPCTEISIPRSSDWAQPLFECFWSCRTCGTNS